MSEEGKLSILQIADVSGVTTNLVKGLRGMGHDVELFQPISNIPHRRMYSRAEILVYRGLDSCRVSKQILRKKYDVVHVHYALLGPMVWPSVHEYYLHCHGSDLINNLTDIRLRAVTRLSLHAAKRVFYVSPDLKAYLRDERPDAIFMPNPIDTGFFSPGGPMLSEKKRPAVLVVSRLALKKGVDIAIEGVIKARESHDFDLMFLNDGVDSKSLLPRIKEAFPDAALVPELDQPSMLDCLRRCDIVLGQMRSGALGMSELEAMSCGKPVIASFRFPEAYDMPPPILDAKDPDGVSEALGKLIDGGSSLGSIGETGRKWVISNHDLPRIAERLTRWYMNDSEN